MTDTKQVDPGGIRLAASFGVVGPLVFVLGIILAGALTPGYSHFSEPVSQLAAFGQPYPAIQMTGFVVFGLSMVAVAYGLRHRLGSGGSASTGAFLIALGGVSMVATGLFRADPMDQDPMSLSGTVHLSTAMVLFPGLIAGFIVLSRSMKRSDHWRDLATFSLIAGLAGLFFLLAYFFAFDLQPDWVGVWQRLLAGTYVIWFLTVSLRIRRSLSPLDERSEESGGTGQPQAGRGGR